MNQFTYYCDSNIKLRLIYRYFRSKMRTKLTASREPDNVEMIIKLSTSASFYIILDHFRGHRIRHKFGTKQ